MPLVLRIHATTNRAQDDLSAQASGRRERLRSRQLQSRPAKATIASAQPGDRESPPTATHPPCRDCGIVALTCDPSQLRPPNQGEGIFGLYRPDERSHLVKFP